MKCLSKRTGEWVLVSAHLPGRSPEPIGILLNDGGDQLHTKFRNDWSRLLSDMDEIQFWRELATDLQRRGCEHSARWVFNFLEDGASHALLGTRQTVELSSVPYISEELYQQHVENRRADVRHWHFTL
jgi:hypothetical protein